MKCREIYAYWDELRDDAGTPMRSQIEPAALRHVLPDLFMLEAHDDGSLIFRLVGTRICALFGRELRGHSFHELWAGGRNNATIEIAHGVILYESPAIMNLVGFHENGDTHGFDMLLLPIRSSFDRCDRLLGALVSTEEDSPLTYPQTLRCLLMDRCRPLRGTVSQAFPMAPRTDGAAPMETPSFYRPQSRPLT